MQPQFEIETVFKPANRETIYVFAKLLNDTSFQLNDNSKLGDIEVENWFDKPRAHNKKGDIRTDLFAFALKNSNDKEKIILGQIVNLIC